MSSTDYHSDDNLDSPASQSRLLQRIDSLDDILDRHEAIFGTGQIPAAEAPSPTLQPTEPSETSWECIESFPSPREIVAHECWDELLPYANHHTRKPYSECTAELSTLLHSQKEGGYHPQFSSPDHSLENLWRTCGSAYRLLQSKPDLRASSIEVTRHLSSLLLRQCPRKR